MARAKEVRGGSSGPFLPISDGSGNLRIDALAVLLGTMTHPEGPPNSTAFARATTVEALRICLSDAEIADRPTTIGELPALLTAALNTPTFESAVASLRSNWTAGSVAGDILVMYINVAVYHPEHASLRKVTVLKHADLVENGGNRTLAGTTFSYGVRRLRETWHRFRPVAHLWAAFVACGVPPPFSLGTNEGLLAFLAFAEKLRRDGESLRSPAADRFKGGPPGRSRPRVESPLDPATTWKVPPDLALPEITHTIPGLTPWSIERLNSYRVHRKKPTARTHAS